MPDRRHFSGQLGSLLHVTFRIERRRARSLPLCGCVMQKPLRQWRVAFLSRLGKTAIDGMASTKEADKVLQGKNWCTLAR